MFFTPTPVLHSQRDDGRHWITTLGLPPLQVWPVAPNHCRAGHFLAKVIATRLGEREEQAAPDHDLELTLDDVRAVPEFEGRYPELPNPAGLARLRLVLLDAPADQDHDDPGEGVRFLTPQPPAGWPGSYDDWIAATCRALGADVPDATHESHEAALHAAAAQLQARLPVLRERWLAGLGSLHLGLKVRLPTRAGGAEYVWASPQDWSEPTRPVCRLDSRPHDCPGYGEGHSYAFDAYLLVDYAIGSETTGVVECGPTQRLAEDHGLVIE